MASQEPPDTTVRATAVRSMRSTVGRESTTFGFSILVTVTFGVVQLEQGSPGRAELVLYALGAVSSFTVLEGLLSRGFRRSMPEHHTDVLVVGTALNAVSVLAGLAAAMMLGALLDNGAAWPLCPLAAGLVYLLVESAEESFGERFQRARGNARAADVEP